MEARWPPIWRPVVRAWSLPSCCFLRQEALFHIVSLHPGVKWIPAIIMLGGNLAMD